MSADVPAPSVNAAAVQSLLSACPKAAVTPLTELDLEVTDAKVFVKDERKRMGLGSFKALGAAYVIAHDAVAAAGEKPDDKALVGRTYVTASAGNHGLSVAAGARIFGAKAVIFLADTVPSDFADRLRKQGAEVRIEGSDYKASMQGALRAAAEEDMTLLSDTSFDGYTEIPHLLMEGYLAMAAEAVEQMPEAPTHIFLQAGVGGLAGACAAYFRSAWGDEPIITVVEPVAAPALQASIEAGRLVNTKGPTSNMGRLDCKEGSLIALKGLSRDADWFVTLSDDAVASVCDVLEQKDLASSPSGIAGIAALFDYDTVQTVGVTADSIVLNIVSE